MLFDYETCQSYLPTFGSPTENWLPFVDDDNTSTWKTKPMIQWDRGEVQDFIAKKIPNVECCDQFANISGNIFQSLQQEYCVHLAQSENVGRMIFETKEEYIRNEGIRELNNNNFINVQRTESDSDHQDTIGHSEFLLNRRPGRPKSSNTLTKPAARRSEKLWQFLINILSDEKTCPDLIKWDNYEEGTFKFVKSHKVAQLWGSRKNNENMNYEKFSRAMRYYYKSQVLLPVPGRRLVYKFGPHAKGWNKLSQNESPT